MRKAKDRDFIQTFEDFLFCVVGYQHPKERYTAYLKYVPSASGKWGTQQHYRRVIPYYAATSVIDTFDFLRKNYPKYLFQCPIRNIDFSSVPKEDVKTYFYPEKKLRELSKQSDLDSLEERVIELAESLVDESGIPRNSLGITGSILIDIHNPEFSDIDFTVYGRENALRVKKAVKELIRISKSGFNGFDEAVASEWGDRKIGVFPLNSKQMKLIFNRKWNFGVFKGTRFSIHPTRADKEISEEYGHRLYTGSEVVKIRAKVSDNSDGIFNPCYYRITDVEVIEGPQLKDIIEVVSYEGVFCDIAHNGETIMAKGKLEKVLDKRNGEVFHRILVGSPEGVGKEFIYPIV
ncbi:MAG: hypothetical protein ACFE7S_02015 [Candidatus Hodarchaeota archaeon]